MRWRLLSVAAVCILLLELALRIGMGLGDPPRVVLDDNVEYRLVQNATYRRFGNRIEINSHGMRAPDHSVTALENERRVLLIGDSVIYGNHFLDQDETIALRLKDRLKSDPHLVGCTPVTIPAAASSWGPVNQAAFLSSIGTLDADIALFIVSAHDLYDVPGGETSLIPYRTRRSFGAIDDAFQVAVERFERRFFAAPPEVASTQVRRAETIAAMNGLSEQLKSNGVPLILIYHPTIPERRNGLRAEHGQFADWAQSKSVQFITLDNERLDGPDMYRDLIHPAAPGADLIARLLEEIVSKRLAPC